MWFEKKKKKIPKNAQSSPGQKLANRCEYIMPVSEVHAEVTDKAGPAGPQPDQLGFIVSIWLSVRPCRPPLDEMQADGINVWVTTNRGTRTVESAALPT